jgi:hypothetical protein
MRVDAFIRAVCSELRAIPDYEKEVKLHHYGNIARTGCIDVSFDIPVRPDDSGFIEVTPVVGIGLGEAARLKFTLPLWRTLRDGPAHGQAETDATDG